MGSLSIWHWIVVIAVVLLLFVRGKISALMVDGAHQVGNLAATKQQQDDCDHHDPVPNAKRTHPAILQKLRAKSTGLTWSQSRLGRCQKQGLKPRKSALNGRTLTLGHWPRDNVQQSRRSGLPVTFALRVLARPPAPETVPDRPAPADLRPRATPGRPTAPAR